MIDFSLQVNDESRSLADFLHSRQEEILELWGGEEITRKALENHGIATDFFIKHFGRRVLAFFLAVCRGEEAVGNCPVIGAMLLFFRSKNLPAEDIYLVCANFKNATLDVTFRHGREGNPHRLVGLIFDANFAGVLHDYMVSVCRDGDACENYRLPKAKAAAPGETPAPVVVETPALEQADHLFSHEEFAEMAELEEEIGDISDMLAFGEVKEHDLATLPLKLVRYGQVVGTDPGLDDLSAALEELGGTMEDGERQKEIREKPARYAVIYQCVVNDLTAWREAMESGGLVPVNQKASLLSSVQQLQNQLTGSAGEEEEELELF